MERESESDRTSVSSDTSADAPEYSEVFSLQPDSIILHMISKFELKSLESQFKSIASFTFQDNTMTVHCNNLSLKEEVKKWVCDFNYKQYRTDGKQGSKIFVTDCRSITDELHKSGINLFRFIGRVYIGGHRKGESELEQARTKISASYFDDFPSDIFPNQRFSKTHRFVFRKLFSAIYKKEKYATAGVLSIQPRFSKGELRFMTRSTIKVSRQKVLEQVKKSFKKYIPLVLIVTKPQSRYNNVQISNLEMAWKYDKTLKEQYLCVVFKKSVVTETVYEELISLRDNCKFKIIGVRYFLIFTRRKVEQVLAEFQGQSHLTEIFPPPPQIPYSVTIKGKVIVEDQATICQYIQAARPPKKKGQEAEKEESIQISQPQSQSIDIEDSYMTTRSSSIFQKGQLEPCTLAQEKATQYMQAPIVVVSKQFQSIWASNQEESVQMAIEKYPWQSMTISKLQDPITTSSTRIQQIDKLLGTKEYVLIGKVKLNLFKSQRGSSIMPILYLTKKE